MVEGRPPRRDSNLAGEPDFGTGIGLPSQHDPITFAKRIATLGELRRVMKAAGRDAFKLQIVPMGILPAPDKLDYYASLGVSEATLRLPSAEREEVLPVLDDFTRYLSNRA